MAHILVVGSHYPSVVDQKEKLEQEGYIVTGTNDLDLAKIFLSGPTQFDFVLSGALRWEAFCKLAIQKYGNDKVIVYTVLLEDAKRLHEEGIHAFYKDDLDHHPLSKRFEQVINEIETLLAIQKISPKEE